MIFLSNAILGLTPRPAEGAEQPWWSIVAPFAMIFGVFYFLVFAPMKKKQRQHTELLASLKAGDRVITNGGIHGRIVGVTDDIVQVKIADQVKIEVTKSAIATVHKSES